MRTKVFAGNLTIRGVFDGDTVDRRWDAVCVLVLPLANLRITFYEGTKIRHALPEFAHTQCPVHL
jgi:hypothetical protein